MHQGGCWPRFKPSQQGQEEEKKIQGKEEEMVF